MEPRTWQKWVVLFLLAVFSLDLVWKLANWHWVPWWVIALGLVLLPVVWMLPSRGYRQDSPIALAAATVLLSIVAWVLRNLLLSPRPR